MPMNTKQVLTDNIHLIDLIDVPERHKAICRDYVAGMPSADIRHKYNFGQSRLSFILRFSARTILRYNKKPTIE